MKITSVKQFLAQAAKHKLLSNIEEQANIDDILLYKRVLKLATESSDERIVTYFKLIEIRDNFIKEFNREVLNHEWAKLANLSIKDLGQAVEVGQQEWAKLANLSVRKLSLIQHKGIIGREKIINHSLYLVLNIATEYQHRGLDLSTSIEEGMVGLNYAISKFDNNKQVRFNKFATFCIEREIKNSINQHSEKVDLPSSVIFFIAKLKRIRQKMFLLHGEYPSLGQLAKRLGTSKQRIIETFDRTAITSCLNPKVDRRAAKALLDWVDSIRFNKDITSMSFVLDEIDRLDVRERKLMSLRHSEQYQDSFRIIQIDPGRIYADR